MIKLKKPYRFVIFMYHKDKLGAFELEDGGFIFIGTTTIYNINDSLLNKENNDIKIVEGDDVIPFIVYHNWMTNLIAANLKSMGKGGKHKVYLETLSSIIDEDTGDYDIDHLISDHYTIAMPSADYQDFVNTKGLYIKMINKLE